MTFLAGAFALFVSTISAHPADLVLVSAKIWTGDRTRPEATALAARDGRIVAVGSDEEIRAWKGPKTVVLEGKGRWDVPGGVEEAQRGQAWVLPATMSRTWCRPDPELEFLRCTLP